MRPVIVRELLVCDLFRPGAVVGEVERLLVRFEDLGDRRGQRAYSRWKDRALGNAFPAGAGSFISSSPIGFHQSGSRTVTGAAFRWRRSAPMTTSLASLGRSHRDACIGNYKPTPGALGVLDESRLRKVGARQRYLQSCPVGLSTHRRGNPAGRQSAKDHADKNPSAACHIAHDAHPSSAEKPYDFFDTPHVIGDPGFHRRGHASKVTS